MKHFCHKICLVVLACFSYLSASAYDFEADGLYFTITSLKDLTVSVDGAVNKDTDKIVIPQTVVYKGRTLTVTSVGDNAFSGSSYHPASPLQSVSLPNTILSIGDYAFSDNINLTEVVLPEQLLEIGKYAFSRTSIKNIRFPSSLTSISEYAFFDNINLTEVVLPEQLLEIGKYAFSRTSIKNIRFPSSLTSIGESAFSRTKLCSIALPDNIEYIPYSCFAHCDSLKSIQWPKRLRSIGPDAFGGCEALTNFTIPPSVVEISPSIIWGCSNISKLTIGKGLNGLPFYHSLYNDGYVYEAKSLETHYKRGEETSYFSNKLDTVIIEDAHDEFSIKGYLSKYDYSYVDDYLTYPAFNDGLNYFYVGRPLIDISKWGDFEANISVHGTIKKLEIAGTCTENPPFYRPVDTLILGKNIASFYVNRLDYYYSNYLDMIICKSTTPPVVCNGPFSNKVYTDVTLYVPKGCKDAYSKDSEWGLFWDIQEFEDDCNTEVTNVTDNFKDIVITTKNGSIIVSNAPHNTLVQVYNLQGALVAKSKRSVISGLSKGAYLVNVGGKTFKVVL